MREGQRQIRSCSRDATTHPKQHSTGTNPEGLEHRERSLSEVQDVLAVKLVAASECELTQGLTVAQRSCHSIAGELCTGWQREAVQVGAGLHHGRKTLVSHPARRQAEVLEGGALDCLEGSAKKVRARLDGQAVEKGTATEDMSEALVGDLAVAEVELAQVGAVLADGAQERVRDLVLVESQDLQARQTCVDTGSPD